MSGPSLLFPLHWTWAGLLALLVSQVCLICITHLHVYHRIRKHLRQAAAVLLQAARVLARPSCSSKVKQQQQQQQQQRKSNLDASDATNPVPLSALPTPCQLAHVIKTRRSIYPKHMTGRAVSNDSLMALLEAANWAPTHGRTEPWRFVVLGKQGMKDMQDITQRVVERYLAGNTEHLQDVIAQLEHDRLHRWHPVSHMVAICMRRQANPNKLLPLWEELAAVSCAVQNMHLMATVLGVAAYWSSWHELARDSPEMLHFLGLDHGAGDRCWGFLVLGVAEREVVQGYRGCRQPIMDKVVFME